MIEQLIPFEVVGGAPPENVAPTNFNPVPADGFVEVMGCIDPTNFVAGDLPPAVSITLGGATPYTPVPYAALRVNVDGVVGAGPGPTDRVMSRQGVRQGTNLQINLQGGTHTYYGRLVVRFTSAEEISAGAGAIAS
jgi:hypothetical protein